MAKKRDVDDVLGELEKLAEDINVNENKKKSRSNRKKASKKVSGREISIDDEKIKQDLSKVKEIKKSLDVLEREIFIKINDPQKIVNNLIESKKIVKDITTSLMALVKLIKLRGEILEKLEKDIESLREISKKIEKELNLEEYAKTLGNEVGNINEEVISQYIDTIEEDIEEIKRYIGVAK